MSGDDERSASTTDGRATAGRFECKVCWTVYDPAIGDPVWQIAPGTPFSQLPPHWTCPNCSTEQSGFLPLDD
jgi:rubredoxin